MNKQLIQEIINVGNKAINTVPLKYSVETKDMTYYGYDGLYYDGYDGLYYDNNQVQFVYDYDNEIRVDND